MTSTVTVTLNPSIDTSTSAPRVVAERKLRCTAPRHDPGGGGINVARATARLGGAATALYLAGGPTGALLGRLLDEEGIDRRVVATEGSTRENVIVLEAGSGLQYRFGMPGAEVRPAAWQEVLDEVRSLSPAPAYLVASGSLPPGVPPDAYARLGRIVRERGGRLVLDASGEALREALEARPWLVKPNVGELADLVGHAIEDETQLEAVTRDLIANGRCEALLVSLGAGGALFATAGERQWLRAPTVPIRSKVGAGDSTVGGIVLALTRGWSLAEAMRFGVAAGSAAVMSPGTRLCERGDTERLYRQLAGSMHP